jgi:LmbE family N-acetylglucosaminyl deacetylase
VETFNAARRSYKRFFSALTPLLLILVVTNSYDYFSIKSRLRVEDIPSLTIAEQQKLLVIAPHPDDDIIGAGGLIQEILTQHGTVKVVMVTNGDGQAVAPLVLHQQFIPKSTNYIAMGSQRQKEAIDALQYLGVNAYDVIFLGYPDHGLYNLWINQWSSQCPWKSRYTRKVSSPYSSTFDPASDYCGNYLLSDLQKIISDYRPDMIVIPYPEDENLDHRATSNFARMAIMHESYLESGHKPLVLEYLVHYGYYPSPRGKRLHEGLLPPRPLLSEADQLLRLDLSPNQVAKKYVALYAHVSQIRLLGNFLSSFVRRNEILFKDQSEELGFIEFQGYSSYGFFNQNLDFPEPQRENMRRLIIGSSDLTALHILRLNDRIIISANTRNRPVSEFDYRFLIKSPDGATHVFSIRNHEVQVGPGSLFRTSINLKDFNIPTVLGFSAEVRGGVSVLDRTGWYFVFLTP